MAKLSRIHGLQRGNKVRVTIESLAPGGDGVGHVDGVAIFAARTAPGDTVDIELFDVRKSFARGKVVEVIVPSKDRDEPVCNVFDRCGGCQWQHITYESQLKTKHEIVVQALRHIDGVVVEPTLGAQNVVRYRNKAQFPVKANQKGKLRVGYFEVNSHKIVDLNECPVQPELLDAVLQELKYSLVDFDIAPYDEEQHTGLIRHICARQSFANEKILVTLVMNLSDPEKFGGRLLGTLESIADELRRRVKEVKGVCLNFNSSRGNKIFGDTTICISGKDEIEEVLKSSRPDRPAKLTDGIKFRLTSQSFFQINTEQAANLFDEVYDQVAAEKDRLGKPLRAIDAYAGVGSIALWITPLVDRVVCIEESADTVRDGLSTVQLNEVDNVFFEEGRAEDVLARMAEENFQCDVVILDPPRKGASSEVLDALLKLAPQQVIYVSCNPQTLARDLKILQDGIVEEHEGKQVRSGYKTKRVKPVDLFPQTYHVESVATLERYVDDGPVGNLEEI